MLRSLEKLRIRHSLTVVLLLFVGGLALGSCDRASSPTQLQNTDSGEMSVAIRLSKRAAANISRAEVVVTGTGMAEIRQNLTISGNTISGTLRGISAGANRLFTLNGYDSSGSLTYTGSAGATVVAGQMVTEEIPVRSISAGQPTAQLEAKGIRVNRGENYSGDFSTYGSIGEDVKITGEIVNDGNIDATGVRITVSLRDSGGALLGRVRGYSIGSVPAGESVFFSVIIESVFSYSGSIGTLRVEVDFDE